MAEILPGIHLVDGVDPSPDFTTHVYLVKDKGASYTLIDCGLPGSERPIAAYLQKQKIEPSSIKKILLTHLHRDHTGALQKMIDLTKARTFSHWLEAAYIAMDPPYDGPGTPPAEPVRIDEPFKDGDPIDAAGGLIAYHTPGHTPGHVSYYQAERKILFSGDLFFVDGSVASLTPPDFTHHTLTAKVSARRMAQLSVDSLLSYHGGPILSKGGAAIRQVAQSR